MVGNPGRTADTRRIRRLKTPQALEVEAGEDGAPLRLRLGGPSTGSGQRPSIGSGQGAWQDVRLTRRPWRIDQHWWRGEPVSRLYYRLAAADGPPFTVYHDLTSGAWARQEYA